MSSTVVLSSCIDTGSTQDAKSTAEIILESPPVSMDCPLSLGGANGGGTGGVGGGTGGGTLAGNFLSARLWVDFKDINYARLSIHTSRYKLSENKRTIIASLEKASYHRLVSLQ